MYSIVIFVLIYELFPTSSIPVYYAIPYAVTKTVVPVCPHKTFVPETNVPSDSGTSVSPISTPSYVLEEVVKPERDESVANSQELPPQQVEEVQANTPKPSPKLFSTLFSIPGVLADKLLFGAN